MKRSILFGAALALASSVPAVALARPGGVPQVTITFDSLRLTYASTLHHRYFSSCTYAVTGVRDGVVRAGRRCGELSAQVESGAWCFGRLLPLRRHPVRVVSLASAFPRDSDDCAAVAG